MGNKESKKDIHLYARQKADLGDIPLIVEQAGNGDGIPISAPGLATLMNDVDGENKSMTERNLEAMTLEKEEVQHSPELLDGNDSQPPARDDANSVPHAAPNLSSKKGESSTTKGSQVLQDKGDAQSLPKKPSISPEKANAQFSIEPPSQTQECQTSSSSRRETSYFLRENEDSRSKNRKDPFLLITERKGIASSKGTETSPPLQVHEKRSTAKKEKSSSSSTKKPKVARRKTLSVSLKKDPSRTCPEQENCAISATKNRKDAVASMHPGVQRLRQLFEENTQASPHLSNTEERFERKTNSPQREDTMVTQTSWNSPSKAIGIVHSENEMLHQLRQVFEENAHDTPELANASLNFETSINESSLGSLLNISSYHGVESPKHSLRGGTDSENRTRNNGCTEICHEKLINRGKHQEEEDRKKPADLSNAIKISSNIENFTASPSMSVSRGNRSDRELMRREQVTKRNASNTTSEYRTAKEMSTRQTIPSKRTKDETRSENGSHLKPLTSVRNWDQLREHKAEICRTSQREPLNSSQKKTDIHHKSRKMMMTDKVHGKHECHSGKTSKMHEESIRRNLTKTRSRGPLSRVQESIDLKKSRGHNGQGVGRNTLISRERLHSKTQTHASKKTRAEKGQSSGTEKHRDSKRERISAELFSCHAENDNKETSKPRERLDTKGFLLPFGFCKMLGRDFDGSAVRDLEHGISNTIFQVMETVEKKIAKECFAEKNGGRSKSFRK